VISVKGGARSPQAPLRAPLRVCHLPVARLPLDVVGVLSDVSEFVASCFDLSLFLQQHAQSFHVIVAYGIFNFTLFEYTCAIEFF